MSLESERRAIGKNNEAARRGIGDRMIKDRATIRAGISAARASTFKSDLNTLETPPRKSATLKKVEEKGVRPAAVGTGTYKAPAATGGGIASPLTEKTKVVDAKTLPDRDYWPSMLLTTSDGLLTFEVKPLKAWKFTDADDNPVQMNIAKPAAP